MDSHGERSQLLRVGLTGGIASGKSVVGEMFARLGARIILADDIAHQLMQPGQSVYAEVVQRFGTEILNSDGTVDRPKLAELAFGSGGRVKELNAIVHPAVIAYENEWMDEVGSEDPRLKIPEDAARAEVMRRMAAQLPDEKKIEAADFVIDNSRSLDATEAQVDRVYATLKSM